MKRNLNGRLAFAALLSILLTGFANECDGHWGGGSYGSSGGSSGKSYGSYGSSGGSSGHFRTPVRTYLRHVANRVAAAHYYYGSSGHYGSSGGSSGYRYYYRGGSSGGSSGSTVTYYRGGSSGGSSGQVMPRMAPQAAPPKVEPPKPEKNEDKKVSLMRTGYLTVSVPASTRIYVNEKLTRTPGTFRRFKTPGIEAGSSLSYQVKAVLEKDGKELVQTKVVDLTAGASKHLDFVFEADPSPVTVLSLNVPEDAEVTLAGNLTSATGSLRMFTTTNLKEGESWEDYRIEVAAVVNGKRRVESKTIQLVGGETVDLSFDFGSSLNTVASR